MAKSYRLIHGDAHEVERQLRISSAVVRVNRLNPER